jgi:hypothetical protein
VEGVIQGLASRLHGGRGDFTSIFGSTDNEYFDLVAFFFGTVNPHVQSLLDCPDSLDGSAGHAEVSHGLDNGTFEPSLELLKQAFLDFLVLYAYFPKPLLITGLLYGYTSSCFKKVRG